MDDPFMDLVRRRQSTRRYTNKPVPREVIERCLEAARLAPSACNSQPWSFIVADTEPLRSRLAQAAFSGVYGTNAFAARAPVLVAVVAERSQFAAAVAGHLRRVAYNLIDAAIACEHFVLEAEAQGVGTCWLGWFHERAVVRALGLPRRTHIPILISMGYSAEPRRAAKRKPLDAIRRYAS
jgi:nitroreductase